MTEPIWLLEPAIVAVHHIVIARFGGSEGLRDEGLLASALARPINLHNCENCTELPRLAASYTAGIVQNHPFVDGNKRTGLSAAYVFLDLNGMPLQADEVSAPIKFHNVQINSKYLHIHTLTILYCPEPAAIIHSYRGTIWGIIPIAHHAQ